jgi:hypothetical protein
MKEMRNIMLADEGNQTIALCIWGDFANKFDIGPDDHPVLAVKRSTVSEYGGKSLNSNEDSQLTLNPPHPRTQ